MNNKGEHTPVDEEMNMFSPGAFETIFKHGFVDGDDVDDCCITGLDITIDGDMDLIKANDESSVCMLVVTLGLNGSEWSLDFSA